MCYSIYNLRVQRYQATLFFFLYIGWIVSLYLYILPLFAVQVYRVYNVYESARTSVCMSDFPFWSESAHSPAPIYMCVCSVCIHTRLHEGEIATARRSMRLPWFGGSRLWCMCAPLAQCWHVSLCIMPKGPTARSREGKNRAIDLSHSRPRCTSASVSRPIIPVSHPLIPSTSISATSAENFVTNIHIYTRESAKLLLHGARARCAPPTLCLHERARAGPRETGPSSRGARAPRPKFTVVRHSRDQHPIDIYTRSRIRIPI